ncbi:MAG: hypothetical protein KBS85_06565 [Lachnospiraceae bacterium]|nr:hypothetical protein [Candidatus Merdinaster equi]
MSMNVGAVGSAYTQYAATAQSSVKKAEDAPKQNESGVALELSSDGMKAYEANKKDGSVVAKSDDSVETKTDRFATGKLSEEERAGLVKQLQAQQDALKNNMINLVKKMFGQQAGIAEGDETSIWRFLADGKFEVDPETKAEAQQAISEDGFYGVKQTSERLFEFAQALAGDDVDKMKKMQDAIQKGYDKATEMWGKELPEISKNTLNAVNDLFSQYYDSKAQA